MSLTPEQKEIRATGIGASEIAAVVEMHPYKAPIDVWMAKPNPHRGSLVEDDDQEAPRAEVGTMLEEGIRQLFERRTGKRLARPGPITLRHPSRPYVLASPDDLLADEDAGLEIKVVGSRMAHHWESDSLPDYVLTQSAQNMAVTGRSLWHVAALVGGTDLRLYVVQRDTALEESLLVAAEMFWEGHVLVNVAPAVRDAEERRRYLRARYPGSGRNKCRAVGNGEAAELAKILMEAEVEATEAALKSEAARTALCELVGEDYGIEGPWGRFLWYPRAGQVAWKRVAEEIAGGAIPLDVIEKHRGEGSRVPMLLPPARPALKRGTRA